MLRTIVLFALASTTAGSGRAETLRVVAFIPQSDPLIQQSLAWIEEINQALGDRLDVHFLGGPEVFPRPHLIEALRNGVVEMVFTVTSDYQDELPEVSAFALSRLGPSEERETGFYEFMVQAHERINIRYIGRVQYLPFYLYVKEPPGTLADLRGRKIRTGSLYNRFIRELGMVPVTISSAETYTALERGVVDGFAWPSIGARQRGWLEEVGHVVDLPFFEAGNAVVLMNLVTWKSLPATVRNDIIRVTADFEPRMVAHFREAIAVEHQAMARAGLNRVAFSAAENREFLDTAYRVEWAAIARRAPELVDDLRRLSGY